MTRLRDKIKPGITRREEFPLVPRLAALLIVDVQTYLSAPAAAAAVSDYFATESLPRATHNIDKLARAFRVMRDDRHKRRTGCEVVWTYLQAKTRDGRDISTDYRLSGATLANIPRAGVSFDDMFLPDLRPDLSAGKGDILLSKTSCSVFQSTNLDYLLRNLGVEQLVVVGQMTDQCVESAVRDAADLGYLVTVVEDACAAASADAQAGGLRAMRGFARVVPAHQVMDELLADVANTWYLQQSQSRITADADPGAGTAAAGLNDAAVVQYLRDKGMCAAADHLTESFFQMSLRRRESLDKGKA